MTDQFSSVQAVFLSSDKFIWKITHFIFGWEESYPGHSPYS